MCVRIRTLPQNHQQLSAQGFCLPPHGPPLPPISSPRPPNTCLQQRRPPSRSPTRQCLQQGSHLRTPSGLCSPQTRGRKHHRPILRGRANGHKHCQRKVCLLGFTSIASNPALNRSTCLGFQYDVEASFFAAVWDAAIGEWIVRDLKSICLSHALSVRGTKADLIQRVKALYRPPSN